MIRFFMSLMAFLVLSLAAGTAVAQSPEHYSFDKAHTQILFFADHLGFSKSQGEFLDYDGFFVFNPSAPAESSVEITINTDSINMDDERWDTHMKSGDFFDVEHYPTMTFKSTSIEILSEKTANITGDLTMLGVTKPIILSVMHNKSGRHPFNEKYVSGFSAHTTVQRSEFGMTYGAPLLGDEIEIRLEVEGVREDQEGQEPHNK